MHGSEADPARATLRMFDHQCTADLTPCIPLIERKTTAADTLAASRLLSELLLQCGRELSLGLV